MELTKLEHSCVYVCRDNKAALFDPGVMSTQAISAAKIIKLDDIFITHGHIDHFDPSIVSDLVSRFPNVRITAPQSVVTKLAEQGIAATSSSFEGISLFDSPHETVKPLFPGTDVDQIGVTYQGVISHPGDSHSFTLTQPALVLALPVTAPWGTSVRALQLALELRPKFVLPIHDWHWRDEARIEIYETMHKTLRANGSTFLRPVTGQTLTIDI